MPDSVMLGAGHRQIVMGLDARITALQAGEDRPRMVLLQGASGVGKSRIIRELYRWWADHQSAPAYWPPLPEIGAPGPAGSTRSGMGTAAAALANRHVIGPPSDGFVWPPGALPKFTWWPFNCGSMSNGDAIDVIAQARPTVQAHLKPAALAWRQSASAAKRLGKLDKASAERLREALEEGRNEMVDDLLTAVFGAALPFSGLVLKWLGVGVQKFKQQRADVRAIASPIDLGAASAEEQQSAAEQVGAMVLSTAGPTLPAVVVVEDIHLMGESFAQFLEVVQTRNPERPVLIVGSAWPEAHDRVPFGPWRDRAQQAGQLDLVDVPGLPTEDLHQLVYDAAPNTNATDADRLTGHYPNPLALQLFLGLDSTRRRIARHGGALPLSDIDISGPPREDVRDLYRLMWKELPKAMHRALSLAAGVLPPHTDLTWPFLPDVVAAAGIAIGEFDVADATEKVDRALRAAVDVNQWIVTAVPSGAYRFREAVLDDIAAESLNESDRREVAAAAITRLRQLIDERRGDQWLIEDGRADDLTLLVARWLWQLPPDDGDVTESDFAAGVLSAQSLAVAHQPAAARRAMTSRRWQKAHHADHPAQLDVRSALANWAGESGRTDDAVSDTQALLLDRTRVQSPDHADTLHTRNDLAHWLGESGRTAEAIEQLETLLEDRIRVQTRLHPDILRTRNDLAHWLGESGQTTRVIEQLQALLEDRIRVQVPDHPDTLHTRNNLANWLAKSGQITEAVEQLQTLLEDRKQVLGRYHRSTLHTRGILAHWLGESGRITEAIEQLQTLLEDRTQGLSLDHPSTLHNRNDLAHWLGESGRITEAIEQLQTLLEDRIRVQSRLHPDILRTQDDLAHWLGESGRITEAIEQLQILLEERTQGLGRDHPSTVHTREDLAYWIRRAQR